jgi:glutathione S-transferase
MSDVIYHLALLSDWVAAQEAGDYRVSTLGVTLEQEGFIHASRADQWEPVRERFYADVTEPLVLLVIDPARLTSELRVDFVAAAGDSFPHVYGPINLDAVVETREIVD